MAARPPGREADISWPTTALTLCAYCGNLLDGSATLEHVIPRSLGGATVDAGPSVLKILAHGPCNNLAANDADARTALGWIAMMERHRIDATARPDESRVTMAPISPRCLELPDGQVVDCWCPTPGWFWYHVHEPWPNSSRNAATFVRPPSGSGRQGGIAFLAATVTDDKQALTHPDGASRAVRSGRAQFKGNDLYWLNISGSDHVAGFSPLPTEHEPIRDAVLALAQEGTHNGKLPAIDVEGHRSFIAKVVLGAGAALFGDPFVSSPAAMELRKVLTADSFDEIDALGVDIVGFGRATENAATTLSHRNTHQFVLLPHDGGVMFVIMLWGNPWFTAICRADFQAFERLPEVFQGGLTFTLDLVQRRVVGPLPWARYISWATGHPDADLDAEGLPRPELEGGSEQ